MAKLRQWIALCGCTVLAVVIFIFFFHHGNEFSYSVRKDIHVKSIARQTSMKAMDAASSVQFASLKDFIETRNNLSRLLNAKQQELGKLQCEAAARDAKNKEYTSNTGGWCIQEVKDAREHEQGGLHKTDLQLAAALGHFFKDQYVGSFGDGPGRYKQLLTESGLLKGYDAYDGAPYVEKVSEGRVSFLDLTIPQYGLPLYDWIISLEVAEHIPQQYESIYIDNLVRHARVGLIISWAGPGQKGYSHVNTRPFDYVDKLISGLGFKFDSSSTDSLRKAAKVDWLKTNIIVFKRTNISDNMLSMYA